MELQVKRMKETLVPASKWDRAILEKLKDGAVYKADFKRPRSLPHLRRFYAILDAAMEAGIDCNSRDDLEFQLKYALGHVDVVQFWDGDKGIRERSISFKLMTQEDFSTFYAKAVNVLAARLGVDPEELLTAAREQLEGGF